VRGGIGPHPLQARACPPLALPAAFRGLAGVLKAAHQLVADSFELRHIGHVALGEEQRVRGLVRPAGLRIARELRLQATDLTAKLAPAGPLIGLRLREIGGLRRRLGLERRLRREPRRRARGVDRPRQLTRINAARAGPLHRFCGQVLEVRVDGRVVRDEGAETVPGGDQPLLLEAPVDGAGRVDVHSGAARQLAHARQAVARPKLPAGDQHPQAPRELRAQRQVIHPRQIGGERGGRRLRRIRGLYRLCH
jgi:hypothetical protein